MRRHHLGRYLGSCLAAGGLLACGDPGAGNDYIGSARLAFSICDEAVPDELFVDGIPAYDQCAASMDAAIYSNNGVDTSTTALDDTWVRTQWSGGYQCTELAHRYLYFRWGIEWLPRGNAGTWCDDPPDAASGVEQTFTPVHGDVIVFPPGQCGADGYYGHVALVDTVDPGGERLTIVEQNSSGRRQVQTSCAGCFLHVVANTGELGTGGAPGEGGAGPATGGAPPQTGGAVATGGDTPVPTGGAPTGGRGPT
ncbi:MAG TPA: CHAP domain-containing protein, partial [Polyangiaceae bacterium]|nr:CHAP domain-containing protein [Polyangiaceae bacterium]